MYLKTAWWVANCVDPDQMLHSAASDHGLHCSLRLTVPLLVANTVNTEKELTKSKINKMSYANSIHTSWNICSEDYAHKYLNLPELYHLGYWVIISTDDILKYSSLFFFPKEKNRLWHCMQTVSSGDSLHAMSKPIFSSKKKREKNISKCHKKKNKKISKCHLEVLSRMLSFQLLVPEFYLPGLILAF